MASDRVKHLIVLGIVLTVGVGGYWLSRPERTPPIIGVVRATQVRVAPGFTGRQNAVQYPVWIYKMKIDAGAPPNDHR